MPKSYRIPTFLEELEASVAPNGTVALECKVIGVPTPRLVWFKDEKELQTGDSYELKAENNKPTTTYKCVAINCVGSAMSETVLKIKKGENQASCTTQNVTTSGFAILIFLNLRLFVDLFSREVQVKNAEEVWQMGGKGKF